MCVAVLAYMAGHYRLHALWFHAVPSDPRQGRVPRRGGAEPSPLARSAGLVTPAELAWFVTTVPVFALLAQAVLVLLGLPWGVAGLPPRWLRLLLLAWALVVGLFVAAHAFRYWRRRQMDRTTAGVMLQDVLWHETRREQRRLGRWLAWWKLTRKDEAG
jgi:hypothetical protein